jgi:pyroglutamyl-peptidase
MFGRWISCRWTVWTAAAAAAALLTCSRAGDDRETPGRSSPDSDPEGLFHDFLTGGKYDGMGHPFGADVFEAETACRLETGRPEAEGIAARPGDDAPGVLCRLTTRSVGEGAYILNIRSLLPQMQCGQIACAPDTPVVTVRLTSGDGAGFVDGDIPFKRFVEPLLYENTSFTFANPASREMTLEIAWDGRVPVRIDYIEIFQAERRLTISPPSGVPGAGDQLVVEITDFPDAGVLDLSCSGADVTAVLESLLASGEATRGETEFRTLFTAPLAPFLEGCADPSRLKAAVKENLVELITSRVTFYREPPACRFAPDTTTVLLTGFEPFPAYSARDNSSEAAVTLFDGAMFAGVSFMSVVLPVEYDAAPAVVVDVMSRCRPDIVLSFGQGGLDTAVETTAYNMKDTASVAGGVPDNRGVIFSAEPIDPLGPALLHTRLETVSLLEALHGAGVAAGASDNPGRYVCNNVFYTEMNAMAPDASLVGGFIHLPRVWEVDPETQRMLQLVVEAAVANALEVHGRLSP